MGYSFHKAKVSDLFHYFIYIFVIKKDDTVFELCWIILLSSWTAWGVYEEPDFNRTEGLSLPLAAQPISLTTHAFPDFIAATSKGMCRKMAVGVL